MATMASSSSSMPFSVFLLILLLSMFMATAYARRPHDHQEMTHLHLYFHEVEPNGPKPTTALVSSLHSTSGSRFGDIRVFDNYLREGMEPSSRLIGMAQGMIVNTSISGMSVLTAMNFVFTDGEYKGSSLAIYGGSDTRMSLDEHPVVGGSGKFRLARGYTLSKIVGFTMSSVVVEADIFLALHNHHPHHA